MDANRWLHLRHADGFSDAMFERFRAGCALWDAYVQTSIREWARLGAPHGHPEYVCLPPTLAEDRKVATLPIAGHSTLGSRTSYEDAGAYLLRRFFPLDYHLALEEGLTEDVGDGRGYQTNWRQPATFALGPTVERPPFGAARDT